VNYSEANALTDDELAAAVRSANARFIADCSPQQVEAIKRGVWPEPPSLPAPPGPRSHCSDVTIHVPDAFERYYG
jgi:hypothetical protein